ncbi:MAG: hypothetical protein AB9856_20160 [Cellulosilyticaceae bacterium]
MKKKLIILLIILLVVLGLYAGYISWNNRLGDKAKQNFKNLTITAENISPTKATLRFTHSDPEILAKYRILDDCIFIFKETSTPIEYLKDFDRADFKEMTALKLNADSNAVYEKDWEHLYGSLKPGKYSMGIYIIQNGLLRETFPDLRFIQIEIPEK